MKPTPWSSRARLYSLGAGVAVGLVGAGHLVAWLAEGIALPPVQGITMKANAALCFVLCGAALVLLAGGTAGRWRRRAAAVLSGIALAIGALTFAQYLIGIDFGIDQLLATEPSGALATASPNRMGPPASLSFSVIGLALLSLSVDARPNRRPLHESLAVVVVLLAMLSTVGYWYGARALYIVPGLTGIALPTALSLLILATGVLCARPDRGVMARVTADDAGGGLIRALILPVTILPPTVGWLRLTGQEAGWFDPPMGTALAMLAFIVVFAWLTLAEGRRVSASEQQLRAADKRKDEFIAVLSHELRNPLAPIRYALPLIRATRPGGHAARAVEIVERQVAHLTRLVDDLLDVSRITRGRIELRREPVRLDAVVRSAVDASSPAVAEGSHTLEVTVTPDPVWLHADPARLSQIITNLLNNSAKYTPPGGRIALEASVEDRLAVIRVRDNGIGISEDAIGSVFDLFHQVHRPGSSHGGLGIGLSLVRSLVELHGGTVQGFSAGSGKGAEFVVRLPLAPSDAQVGEESPAPPAVGAERLKVLVVDDNRDHVDMLARLVESAGHEVRCAFDGQDAVAEAVRFHPHVVLLDLGLPAMSGLDVARELRRRPDTASARLIALTGWGQEDDRQRTRDAGFDHHLTKPADPAALLSLIREQAGSGA